MICKNCGNEMNDTDKFCDKCGAPMEEETPVTEETSAEENAAAEEPVKEELVATVAPAADDKTAENEYSEKEDSAEFTSGQKKAITKIVSIISYLGIYFLIPALVFKDKPYIKHHANNGLVLFIFGAGSSLIAMIPLVGWIIGGIVGTYVTVLCIIGIVQAARGRMFNMPILGGIKILK